jgi:hypothetical protein
MYIQLNQKLIVMKLSKLEKKVLVDLKKEISNIVERERIEEFKEYHWEDVNYRIENINDTIKLLNREKTALKMLNLS